MGEATRAASGRNWIHRSARGDVETLDGGRGKANSLVTQTVKSLPTVWETQVQSLGQEDPLEKRMATHSSILAWRTPLTEEPGGYSPWRQKELDMIERLTFHFPFGGG